jgi:hypothetical protein
MGEPRENVVRLQPKPAEYVLRCTGCGASVDAPCGCGLPYDLIKPHVLAQIGINDTPNASNRDIAKRLDISEVTVRRERVVIEQQLRHNGAVATATAQEQPRTTRIGLDGKERVLPSPRPSPSPVDIQAQAEARAKAQASWQKLHVTTQAELQTLGFIIDSTEQVARITTEVELVITCRPIGNPPLEREYLIIMTMPNGTKISCGALPNCRGSILDD